ncbi:MAG TPA: hypothetical protein VEK38_01685, partial [Candidatus Bathyarchaeia archaeon]|nr:hypothetical protein [Candidatus Bathyarchaeia archaeon]
MYKNSPKSFKSTYLEKITAREVQEYFNDSRCTADDKMVLAMCIFREGGLRKKRNAQNYLLAKANTGDMGACNYIINADESFASVRRALFKKSVEKAVQSEENFVEEKEKWIKFTDQIGAMPKAARILDMLKLPYQQWKDYKSFEEEYARKKNSTWQNLADLFSQYKNIRGSFEKHYDEKMAKNLTFCIEFMMKKEWDKNDVVHVNTCIGIIQELKNEEFLKKAATLSIQHTKHVQKNSQIIGQAGKADDVSKLELPEYVPGITKITENQVLHQVEEHLGPIAIPVCVTVEQEKSKKDCSEVETNVQCEYEMHIKEAESLMLQGKYREACEKFGQTDVTKLSYENAKKAAIGYNCAGFFHKDETSSLAQLGQKVCKLPIELCLQKEDDYWKYAQGLLLSQESKKLLEIMIENFEKNEVVQKPINPFVGYVMGRIALDSLDEKLSEYGIKLLTNVAESSLDTNNNDCKNPMPGYFLGTELFRIMRHEHDKSKKSLSKRDMILKKYADEKGLSVIACFQQAFLCAKDSSQEKIKEDLVEYMNYAKSLPMGLFLLEDVLMQHVNEGIEEKNAAVTQFFESFPFIHDRLAWYEDHDVEELASMYDFGNGPLTLRDSYTGELVRAGAMPFYMRAANRSKEGVGANMYMFMPQYINAVTDKKYKIPALLLSLYDVHNIVANNIATPENEEERQAIMNNILSPAENLERNLDNDNQKKVAYHFVYTVFDASQGVLFPDDTRTFHEKVREYMVSKGTSFAQKMIAYIDRRKANKKSFKEKIMSISLADERFSRFIEDEELPVLKGIFN